MAERPGKDTKTAGSTPTDDDAGPAPTSDLGAYAPQGSRLTLLMRLDRLRGTDYAAPVAEMLMHLPDGRDFVTGTGLDLFTDLEALLVATPNPLDASVTFLAVRHHLDDAKVRAALTRGAKASDYTLAWRTQDGRPIAERHPLEARRRWRDDRLIMLAAPGLTVVTPRAYRALLLAPAAPPDGGVAAGTGPDGGASAAPSASASGSASGSAMKGGWATLLTRIDAEQGLMPPDGAVMVNAVDMFKSRAPAPGEAPELYGMPIPAAINAVIGIADTPSLDVTAEFKTDATAQQWETQWPTVQRKLRTHPLLVLTGFSTLVTRAQLEREGRRAAAPGGDTRRDAAPAHDGVALSEQPVRRRAAIAAPARSAGGGYLTSHPAPAASGSPESASSARSIRADVRLEPGTHEEARPWRAKTSNTAVPVTRHEDAPRPAAPDLSPTPS